MVLTAIIELGLTLDRPKGPTAEAVQGESAAALKSSLSFLFGDRSW
jgi:hypothetical protein